jgi:hypothetical protein
VVALALQTADAMSYVAGYTVAHDVSARDWQMRRNGGQWLVGKTFDTYCPLGPAIVTTASISGNSSTIWGTKAHHEFIPKMVALGFYLAVPIFGNSQVSPTPTMAGLSVQNTLK